MVSGLLVEVLPPDEPPEDGLLVELPPDEGLDVLPVEVEVELPPDCGLDCVVLFEVWLSDAASLSSSVLSCSSVLSSSALSF